MSYAYTVHSEKYFQFHLKFHLKDNGYYWLLSKTSLLLNVSQHMQKITNPMKIWAQPVFEVNNNERKNTRVTSSCMLSDAWYQILNLRSRNQIRGKLLRSQKLRHFGGSRFSQYFILSTSPHYSLPSKVLC